MRINIGLLILIPTVLLITACGRVSAAMPAGPSPVAQNSIVPAPVPAQNFPSLTGRWRATGGVVFRNLDTGNTLSWNGCSGSFTIATQVGGSFMGPFDTQGGGWNSDRFCTAAGTLSGELLAPDGSLARARLEGNFQNWPRPSVTPACELVSPGDGTWSGSAGGNDIRLQIRDTLRCPANVDGGVPGMPMADFERTVSFTFARW